MVNFDVKKNKGRENYFSAMLPYYIPYEDMGDVSKEDDIYGKIDRKFLRTDTGEEVFVQLKIRAKKYAEYSDSTFRYYGDPKKNEWENTRADESLKIILDTNNIDNWEDAEPILISRLDINKLKNSGYRFIPSKYMIKDKDGKDSFNVRDKTVFLNIRTNLEDGSQMMVFPSSLSTIIPGAYEVLYKK